MESLNQLHHQVKMLRRLKNPLYIWDGVVSIEETITNDAPILKITASSEDSLKLISFLLWDNHIMLHSSKEKVVSGKENQEEDWKQARVCFVQ